ncbi:hypothetical protein M407DRAFT_27712 [Tulasnella calospora MUT 4182]|uniref:Glycoside hydrolase family 16 protein n=1 Tax=Tulasnella calospora MUT 4182 TaxID=1051891 RepID=A0A0C3QDD0_9AGAM|nr:hypothetical protein M407DRAFT_27712 [Tulasnella calospora MUT 4182]
MKLSTLYFASLLLPPSFVAAAEHNFLANCVRRNIYDDGDRYDASYMAWYENPNLALGNHMIPNSLSNEYRDWSTGGQWLHWEGQQHNIYFPASGVTIQTNIQAGARDRVHGAWAGSLQRTSDGRTFQCYRDNDSILFDKDPPVPDGTDRGITVARFTGVSEYILFRGLP